MTVASPNALPRRDSLTRALLVPAPAGPDPGQLERLGTDLRRQLAAAGAPAGPVVDAYALRLATGGQRPDNRRPFHWTARAARRTLGLEALRRCLAEGRAPADAAAQVVAARAGQARRDGARPGSLGHWLGQLGPGGRAAVLAEATGWTTHLWLALDWDRLNGIGGSTLEVGAPDRWWRPRPATTAALRGRVDLRWLPAGGRPALGTVMAGRPGVAWRAELGLAPLVDVLARPGVPAPARVLGLWPQTGRALVLEVDLALLEETAEWVLEAVRLSRPLPDAPPTPLAGPGADPAVARGEVAA